MKYFILINSSPSKGESGESCGSKYDLNQACKNCGTGAKLVGPLVTRKLKKIRENFFPTVDGDLLISQEIYSAFQRMNIALDEISPVMDDSGYPLRLYHLNPTMSFPRSLPQSEGLQIDQQCLVCRRNGYFNEVIIGDLEKGISTYVKPLSFHYTGIDEGFLKKSDIFRTWEHMGLSNLKAEGNRVIRYARPLLIVSERFKFVLETFRLKKVRFSEVIIHLPAMELQ